MEQNYHQDGSWLTARHLFVMVGAALAILGVLGACQGSDEQPARAGDLADRLGVENPVGDRVAEQVTSAVPRAAIKTEIAVLRRAVRTHRHTTGSFPTSLDKLEPSVPLTYPNEYTYDAATGEVQSQTFPEL